MDFWTSPRQRKEVCWHIEWIWYSVLGYVAKNITVNSEFDKQKALLQENENAPAFMYKQYVQPQTGQPYLKEWGIFLTMKSCSLIPWLTMILIFGQETNGLLMTVNDSRVFGRVWLSLTLHSMGYQTWVPAYFDSPLGYLYRCSFLSEADRNSDDESVNLGYPKLTKRQKLVVNYFHVLDGHKWWWYVYNQSNICKIDKKKTILTLWTCPMSVETTLTWNSWSNILHCKLLLLSMWKQNGNGRNWEQAIVDQTSLFLEICSLNYTGAIILSRWRICLSQCKMFW